MMLTVNRVMILINMLVLCGCAQADKRENGQTAAADRTAEKEVHAKSEAPPSWCEGLPVEVEESRAEDGTLEMRQSVVKDAEGHSVPQGLTVQYWETGEKKLEINYHCGVKHGLRTAWHRNGQKWSVGEYVNGRDNGVWKEWSEDGKKVQEFTMNRGVWNGFHTQWYPNGEKRREVRYVHGVIQGPLTFWNDSGKVLASIDFVDGKEQPTPQ